MDETQNKEELVIDSYQIIWKKIGTTRERKTMVDNVTEQREAMEKFIFMKGSFDINDIISIQACNHHTTEFIGDIITSDDEDGIISIMKKEWEESNKTE